MSDPDHYTRTLAQFVVAAQPGDLPPEVVHEAKRALLHWFGCSLGGCRNEAVDAALAAFDDMSGPRIATVIGRKERVDILLAALLNGMSADVLGFSDTHLKTVIHPGGVVGPAVLALAQRIPCSGRDLLHAFAQIGRAHV